MSTYVFTVTQVTQNFTATISNPINLTLSENPDTVNVVTQVSTLTVVNNIQPVTVSLIGGGGGGGGYDQSLNRGDNVQFASVTTPQIFGTAQQPVYFPTGISVDNLGTSFQGGIDLGLVYSTFTNQISLVLALLPLNFGSALNPAVFSIDFGQV